MINRDDHGRPRDTYPSYRHQLHLHSEITNKFQLVMKLGGTIHNHPSGDPTPSRADIDMTRMIVAAAKPLGVAVHDHVIVGRNGHASLKALRLI